MASLHTSTVLVLMVSTVFLTYAMPQVKRDVIDNSVLNDVHNAEDNFMKFEQDVDVDAFRECKANTTDNDLFPYPLHASCSVEW